MASVHTIMDAAFEDAILCELQHSDFAFWPNIGLRAPVRNNGQLVVLDVVLNLLHVEIGILKTQGVDPRTRRTWLRTLEAVKVIRPIHQNYVVVNRGRLGVLDTYFGVSDPVNETALHAFDKYQASKGAP